MITALCLNPSLDKTLHVARLERGGTNRILREETAAGGKGVNVARMAASFGLEARALLFLGRDDEKLMSDALSLWGVDMSAVMLPGGLRVNIKVMDESRGEITELNAAGSPVGPGELSEMEALTAACAANSRWLCLSGSLPPGCPDDYYARLIRAARKAAPGCRIALDAAGESFRAALCEEPDLVKPNLDELSAFSGFTVTGKEGAAESIAALVAGGAREILLSMGSGGALLYTKDQALYSPGLKVHVATTVGAGDAMLAGYIAGKETGQTDRGAFRLALASAAARVAGKEGQSKAYLTQIDIKETYIVI